MSFWLLLEKIHGHIGLLALALCLHPPIALRSARRPSRATRISGYLAAGAVIAVNVIGWIIYPEYRTSVKLDLYRHARFFGLLFEVKEHLAWYAIAPAVAGAVALWHADGEHGIALRRPIQWLFLATFALVAAVAIMGVVIASVNGFDDAIVPP
jgi:hypothetical protein